MSFPLFQVDAFTDQPFTGNPAAVCLCLDEALDDEQMQQIAAEMNLSETAFLLSRPTLSGGAEEAHFDLYWFTPVQEVDLCGHATLASAHVLWEEGHVSPKAALHFHTRSGRLVARRQERGHWIQLDFPAEPVAECGVPDGLEEALGAEPAFVGRNRMDLLVLFDDEATVHALSPDERQLEAIDARGVITTAAAQEQSGYHFASRFFAPQAGVPEDPVTGSAHCALAPFWADRLGNTRLTGRQVSSRGGTVRCEHQGERVMLGGQAVTVLRGTLDV